MSEAVRVVGIDLGKTGCRGATRGGPVVEGPGAPGLADPGGVASAVAAVRGVLSTLLDRRGDVPTALFVGSAGAEAAPLQREELAHALTGLLPGTAVGIASDSVTAHAGALDGAPGTVLAVGTGSVALGFGSDGHRVQVDGWGPWLGDDGSGAWIGRAAMRAVLSARDGRGPTTRLARVTEQHYGDLDRLPLTISASASVARTSAELVPDVITAADEGDLVARGILDAAVAAWVELTLAAAHAVDQPVVAVVGGLAGAPWLMERFTERLPDDLRLQPARGTSLDGALLLAERHDLVHEKVVLRVPPAAAGSSVDDVDGLATEQVRPDLADLDRRGPDGVVDALLAAEATVPAAVAAARPALVQAVRLATDAVVGGGRLLYVGAGSPGRLAALDAAECPPTFGTSPDRVVAVLAGGSEADRRAIEGAEDDAEAGVADLTALTPGPRDLVVGITASGRTPYVLGALAAAREAGAPTVAIVNNEGTRAAAAADVAVELLTGPEVLSGSTRLKAGSAQKISLNVLSTGAMVGAGKAYGAWMVDVVASNEKLRLRARRILREATGVDDERAVALLEESGWHTKTALVAELARVSAVRAKALLEASGGRVREAVEAGGAS
jgi:N-acetylmuramic acid 6-phosphate etherase